MSRFTDARYMIFLIPVISVFDLFQCIYGPSEFINRKDFIISSTITVNTNVDIMENYSINGYCQTKSDSLLKARQQRCV